ncbi:EKC/KEOPS complex subunit BUD32 [Daldinia childiae]|uniref:EKC/KEOPS complex subunit BUD32 n=1 Tax=Daldinia childiae TaxID=326645 RepID=UPI001448288B|nr:EKC/KEOPS complex subunit BUD32 [Daldinia childiae]KAF3057941.1 EKC/KEOPS complex subunit BUD32 [Daldinia childiae]
MASPRPRRTPDAPRILAEARVLARCRRAGVPVPAVYAVDEAAGWSAVGRMHGVGVVHGDLTTSNMMLRPWEKGREPANGHAGGGGGDGLLDGDIVIIDFGLASQSTSDEDRAVDLYVLERAFASTHSRAEGLFTAMLESSYKETFKQAPVVLKKLEEVRMRGRKRSMIG